jgi:hypothetical protein
MIHAVNSNLGCVSIVPGLHLVWEMVRGLGG